jgi:SAM-dependent methyltransferase
MRFGVVSRTDHARCGCSVTVVNRWTESDWANDYLEHRDSLPHREEGHAVLAEIVAATEPVTRVLDLGTGDGFTLGRVLLARPEATGVGVDFSPEMLERARARFGDDARVEIVSHDLEQPLPHGLGEFDLVVSSFAIHHCAPARQRELYGEVLALLAPGGRFANLEHVASPTPALHAAFLAELGITPEDEDPANQLVGLETQLGCLRDLGFAEVECFWKWRELALLSGVRPA